MAVQRSVVTRSVIDPLRSAVVSCTDLVTDRAGGAIPTTAPITGDTRSSDRATSELSQDRIGRIAVGTARVHGRYQRAARLAPSH